MKRILYATLILVLGVSGAWAAQPQYLQSTSTSFAQRGGDGVVEFAATRTVSSVIGSISIDAPDGVIFTGVQGSNLPTCNITNKFPSTRITCEGSSVSGNSYFPFLPIHRLRVSYVVDVAANLGSLSGRTMLNSRYAGVTNSSFTINVASSPEFTDNIVSSGRPRRDVSSLFGLFDGAKSTVFQPVTGVRGNPSSNQASNSFPAVGRLRGTNDRGEGASCSAAVVPSKSGSLVITAAHCLFSSSTLSQFTDFTLCIGETKSMGDPYKIGDCNNDHFFRVSKFYQNIPKVYFNQSYLNGGNASYDIAFIKFERNSFTGKTLEETAGSYGIAFNKNPSTGNSLSAVGYPGNSDLATCLGTQAYSNFIWNWKLSTNDILMIYTNKCVEKTGNLDPGASGGPIFERIADVDGSWEYIVGVFVASPEISWYVPMERDIGFSPILRDWVRDMYEKMADMKAVELHFAM